MPGELDRLEAPFAHVLDDVGDLVGGRLHVHEDEHRLIVREPGVTLHFQPFEHGLQRRRSW